MIYEAADGVGGRFATDVCEGYRLDRGFQVLLTAYPEARRLLDDDALDLRRFYPGGLVRPGGASLNTALASGTAAAETTLEDFS